MWTCGWTGQCVKYFLFESISVVSAVSHCPTQSAIFWHDVTHQAVGSGSFSFWEGLSILVILRIQIACFVYVTMGNGQQHDEAPTKSYTSVKRPQEDKTVGIALIVTNGYEGPRYKLPGTRDDHEKWTRALETLKFDIRSIRNESKANTLEFFRVASTIPVDGKCRYLVFVFAGHGRKGVVYSQDMQEINLQKELLPHLFLHGNFRSVEKLIFLDACRNEDKDKERLSLSDSLVHVWGPGSGAAGYFSFCATPSLYKARGGLSGSAFSDSVTKKIITRVSLPNLVDEVRTELREEAQSQEIEYINPVYEDNLTAGSEKILLNLQSTQGVSHTREFLCQHMQGNRCHSGRLGNGLTTSVPYPVSLDLCTVIMNGNY
jgi:hypothetical protein